MRKTAPQLQILRGLKAAAAQRVERTAVTLSDLPNQIEGWIADNEVRQLSAATRGERRRILSRLTAFATNNRYDVIGAQELRAYLSHVTTGDGNGARYRDAAGKSRPVRLVTVKTYHDHLCCFFTFLVEQGELDISPMAKISKPVVRRDQIDPFTREQVRDLIEASRKTANSKRDEAIVKMLLDTGLRASELCNLTLGDVDRKTRQIRVLGKGNKRRVVSFGAECSRALWNHLRSAEKGGAVSLPVFLADRGRNAHRPLTRSGLAQLIERLGLMAGVQGVRCSPHTFRHTCAIMLLRNGMDIFAVQAILGHTRIEMTQRYAKYAQVDVARQFRSSSPVDRINSDDS